MDMSRGIQSSELCSSNSYPTELRIISIDNILSDHLFWLLLFSRHWRKATMNTTFLKGFGQALAATGLCKVQHGSKNESNLTRSHVSPLSLCFPSSRALANIHDTVWVRPNTVLALGPEGTRIPDYDYTKDIELHLYNINIGSAAETLIPSSQSSSSASIKVTATREQSTIKIQVAGLEVKKVKVFEPKISVKNVVGGKALRSTGSSISVEIESNVEEIVIELE